MKWAGRIAYRCRECNKRFYVDEIRDRQLEKERRMEKERYAKKPAVSGARAAVMAGLDSASHHPARGKAESHASL